MGNYRTAQICENGHCITAALNKSPQESQKFCSECGAPTIDFCPSCNTAIKGEYYEVNYTEIASEYHVPAYCHACGKPYPWTQSALEAAAALVYEEDSMTKEQQTQLVEVLPDIITETPKSSLAAARMKKAIASAGKFTADALRQFVIDFGCEFLKSQMGL